MIDKTFSILFEYEGKDYHADVAYIEPIGDPQFHVTQIDAKIIDLFGKTQILISKESKLTYSVSRGDRSFEFMSSIAHSIVEYLDKNDGLNTTGGYKVAGEA